MNSSESAEPSSAPPDTGTPFGPAPVSIAPLADDQLSRMSVSQLESLVEMQTGYLLQCSSDMAHRLLTKDNHRDAEHLSTKQRVHKRELEFMTRYLQENKACGMTLGHGSTERTDYC